MLAPKTVRVYFFHVHIQTTEWIERTFQDPLYGVNLEIVRGLNEADVLFAEDVTFMEPVIHLTRNKPVIHLAWYDDHTSSDARVFRLEQRATTQNRVDQMRRAIATLPQPQLLAA